MIHTRLSQQWIVALACPVKDQTGRLRAVLVVGTKLERFQNALRMQQLPAGSTVRIVNEKGIVVAQTDDGPNWIGRELGSAEDVAQALAAKDSTAIVRWSDNVERITGSATAHRVPWVVSIGFPTEIGFPP